MKHTGITIIVVAFVALATLYSLIVPLGEGPDEPGHAGYMFFLAREGRLPVQQADASKSDVPGEGHQPPLAYALFAPLAAWLPHEERQFDMPGNPRFTWAGASSSAGQAAELNAVAHGSREYMPWRGSVLAWHMARLVSVALGAATIIFVYLAARALHCRLQIVDCRLEKTQSTIYNLQSAIPLLAAALVAFNPQFLFTSALITNDALLVTLSAALLWLAVRRPRTANRGPRTEDREPRTEDGRLWIRATIIYAIVVGVVLGLALITKQSAIILAPVAVLVVLEQSRSVAAPASGRVSEWASGRVGVGSSPPRPVTPSPRHPVTLSAILAFSVTTLLVSGWWYARNWRLYGDPFGLSAFQAEFVTQPFEATSAAAWLAALSQLHDSFWARFGWMNVPAPGWAIGLFALVELIALTGLLLGGARTLKRWNVLTFQRFNVAALACWPIVLLPLLAFGWVLSFALTAGLVAWQGRLLFPALPAIAIGMAWGLAAWQNREPRTENRKFFSLMWFLVLGSWFLLALWLPFGVIRPAYPRQTLPEPVALERLGTQVYGRFGLPNDPGAELRGWSLSGTTRPGDTPQLTLIWHALGRQNRNWTVFIHLVDAQEQIVAEDNRPPRNDAFPMLQWVAGDWIEDPHPLALPAGLAPGEYRLRVGLFYPRTERRAGMYNQRGRLRGDYLDIGSLTVKS